MSHPIHRVQSFKIEGPFTLRVRFEDASEQLINFQSVLAGELYRSWRGQEGIGMGDIKLMLMIGGFSGLPGLLFALAFGGISATVFAALQKSVRKDTEAASFMQTTFAFGPHLCAAAAAYILFQSHITG